MTINIPIEFYIYLLLTIVVVASLLWIALRVFDKYRPEFAEKIRAQRFKALIGVLVTVTLLLIILPTVLLPIKPGHVGVMWKRFGGGTVTGLPFAEGTVFVFPWNRLVIYSSRYQTEVLDLEVVTLEGLKVHLNLAVRYRPVRSNIPLLHKVVGPDYVNVLLTPEIGSSTRMIVSRYTAEQVYSSEREQIHKQVFEQVLKELRLNERELFLEENIDNVTELVHLEDVMIRDVDLPEKVHLAIINKVNQNYLDQEYEIRLKVAEKEAERKKSRSSRYCCFPRNCGWWHI